MLQVCDQLSVDFDVKFNSTKSVALRIGCRYNVNCEPLELAGDKLKYTYSKYKYKYKRKYIASVKYLGVCLMASTYYKCSVDHVKVKFFNPVFLTAYTLGVKQQTLKWLRCSY